MCHAVLTVMPSTGRIVHVEMDAAVSDHEHEVVVDLYNLPRCPECEEPLFYNEPVFGGCNICRM